MKKVENFDNVPLMTFEAGKSETMPSGLELQLMPPVTYFGKTYGVEPSGIMQSKWFNSGNKFAENTYGSKELVIGDGSELTMLFRKGAKNLRFDYYQVEKYTAEDAARTGKKYEELTDADKCFQFITFDGLGPKAKQSFHQIPIAYTEFRYTEWINEPFYQLIFVTPLVGSLHMDQVTWEDL